MKRMLLAMCALLLAGPAAAQSVRVMVDGEVRNPGPQIHAPGTRLSEATAAAMPMDTAYPTAAFLTRHDAALDQRRLKAGLLHDLGVLEASDDIALTALARDLANWLDAMPVTGRVVTELAPRRQEAAPAANLPLQDGDRVYYPRRPAQISITGAVVENCTAAHVPLQDARDYIASCATRGASRDWLYVVQPDGTTQRLGIALWNRSEPQALAPGAVLYVPLSDRAVRGLDGDFNAEFAAFLATQPVDTRDGLQGHAR